ncbi:hypothetical protein CROQUDRAFT_90573 [Cronartium quercuum f. sp. fusiforme G11]|uniref:WDR5-like beta-propeller domain-containing protein n=1 Tax=Cronartium quercuum f. sp. fusiforme G11 TaxID=708437 RepID=A0A9P6NJM9_9BASI|nr:hypothetical protein CROQUDRAFT_90573 [Cronartium quercuum f. sp. fusiforme G11]
MSHSPQHAHTHTNIKNTTDSHSTKTERDKKIQWLASDHKVNQSSDDGTTSHSNSPNWVLSLALNPNIKGLSSVVFSPDSTKLAIASASGSIQVYSFLLAQNNETVPVPQLAHLTNLTGHSAGVNEIVWSNDSRQIASASDDHSVRVWRIGIKTGRSRKLVGHSHCVYTTAFHPLGTMLVSGSFDETIKLWDASSRRLIRTLPGHSEVVSALDFSRDGSVIVSASFDGLTRLWDTATGQCLKTLVVAEETNAPVSFVAFTPNSNYLLTCALDSVVRLWDYKTKEGTVVKSYTGHTNTKYAIPARVMALGEDGRAYVVMGSEEGKVWIWDLQSRECVQIIESHQDTVIGLAIYPGSRHGLFVTAGLERDPVIRVFRLDEGPSGMKLNSHCKTE